ncbi:hypothetical protein GALMADRAFT_242246 [Galerina marginata CBS 339.88]|uniref:F-box domain-containing protein n=1 Tax=Galerina marginata (strain CBS 339.88) TaxID=685588 RepID=A0A067TJF3_GALM3|nr:hypothetical protein GALMADRAFT_242246 [Galerina marginata CBS 339.88]
MALLPPELLRLITEYLTSNRRALYALTLASKALRWEATRLLYSSMTATYGKLHVKFLSTIHKSPAEFAPLVRVYHLPTWHSNTGGQKDIWNLILKCLPLMVNLKELAFHKVIGSPSKIFPPLGDGCPAPFQLDKFSWTESDLSNNETYEAQALSFLETQPELTQLYWASHRDLISTLPVNACPKLKRLEGRTNAIRAIIPSRSVTELHWLNPWYRGQLEVLNLKGLRTLRAISIESYTYLRLLSATLAINPLHPLSNVEAVELCIVYVRDSSHTDFEQLPAILSSFPQLKKLVITTPKGGARYRDKYDPTSQISQLFAQLGHLKFVDFLLYPGPVYRRWVDGVLLPNLLSIDRNRILELE